MELFIFVIVASSHSSFQAIWGAVTYVWLSLTQALAETALSSSEGLLPRAGEPVRPNTVSRSPLSHSILGSASGFPLVGSMSVIG